METSLTTKEGLKFDAIKVENVSDYIYSFYEDNYDSYFLEKCLFLLLHYIDV